MMKKTIILGLVLLLIITSIFIFFNTSKPDIASIMSVGEMIKELEYSYKTSDEIRNEITNLDINIDESVINYIIDNYAKDEVYELNISELYNTFPPDAKVKNPTNEYDSRIYEKEGNYFIKIDDLEMSEYGLFPVLFEGSIIDLTEWDVYGNKSIDKETLENIYKFNSYTKNKNTYNIIYKSILTNSNLYIKIDLRFNKIIEISVEKR